MREGPPVPTAVCNGIELYYELHGEGEPPLICVMGLAADSRNWVFNLPEFAAKHRTLIFDNRDVGRSGYAENEYAVADMATDALALADALEIDRFHLLGVSLGGAIAQEVALAAPDRIQTLTVAVSWAGGGRWWRARGRSLWRAVPLMSRDELIEQLLMLNISAEAFENEELFERAKRRILEQEHPQQPEGFFRQAKAANGHDARERLGGLSVPTHVIAAERDVLVPAFMTREIAELIPAAKLSVLDRAPHGSNMERAEDFNELVLGFLGEHS
jgi:pimeloyl-ACP methyl ester carboxylesterase